MTEAQDVVDSAVDRRSAEWVRENTTQVLAPLKLLGIDADLEDVDIPEGDDLGEDSVPDSNPTSTEDPFQAIRENRDAVEHLAEQDREDSLAAWARIMLALADDEDADPEDLEKAGLAGREW